MCFCQIFTIITIYFIFVACKRFWELVICFLSIVLGGWQLSTSVSVSISKQRHWRHGVGSKKGFVVRATSSFPESSEPSSNVAPLKLESPIGQFLSQILISHPHLVPAAVERQLEQFQTDLDGDNQKREPSASGTDLVLYRFALYLIFDTLLSVVYDLILLINLKDSFLLFSKKI